VQAQDWIDPVKQYLSFSIAGGTDTDAGPEIQMKSGDTIKLTVTLLADPANTAGGEADAVLVSANGPSNTATAAHFWPFVVLTTAEAKDAGVSTMKRARPARAWEHSAARRPRWR
jgi:hypothetical protein